MEVLKLNDLSEMSMLFGGDYNPEQWPEDSWQDDIDKLKRADINSATINVFSWALLEPRESKYDFTQLDRLFELLEKNGINVILATSTGALPMWMSTKYPEVNRVNVEGVKQKQGKRHNACPNNRIFQKLVRQLVERIAERYAKKGNLVAWHVSNEYEGYCYCNKCVEEFRRWLQNKYKNLPNLNQGWNSNFWSHTINDWNEIIPPMLTTDLFSNGKSVLSGAEIDYRRFQSESLLKNFMLEKEAIKKFDRNHPVTTNFMGSKKDIDYFKWAPHIDIISWDSYPMPDDKASKSAMEHDLMRGLKQKPFILMEQTPNQQNWYPFNKLKQPNEMRMLSYQALAHGANGINFFQLKQSRSGAEKFHGAVLTVGDAVNSRTYREVQKLGKELASLPTDLQDSKFKAEVAIVFDWESYWGLENSIGPLEELSYVDEVQRFYKAFYDSGISVDFVSKTTNLEGYTVVVAPVLYMWNDEFVANITKYVKSGGRFLTTYLSGIANENDQIFVEGYLSPLQKLLGIKIDERDARSENEAINIVSNKGRLLGKATGVCDLVISQGAKSVAHYGKEVFYSDCSAITVNDFEKGKAFYCGAGLDTTGMKNLIQQLVDGTSLDVVNSVNFEVSTRISNNKKYTFIINTIDQTQDVKISGIKGVDLLSNKELCEKIHLEPFGTVILKSEID